MSQGYDVKATLTICMQTEDTISFTKTLENTQLHFNLLIDPLGNNIFHDIANCIIREDLLLSFLTIFISQLRNRYEGQANSILKEMINTQTYLEKKTPLIIAVQHNKFKIVKEFVKIGADFRIKDKSRQGPLHIAAANGRIGIFVYFYAMGVSPDEEDENLRTPLHLSAYEGEEAMSNIIIAWNKEIVNKQDKNGQTALHLATFAKSYRIVRHLLINGAHRKIKDKEGKTPLQYAKEQNTSEIITILKPSNCIDKINPCKPPIKPVKKSRKLFTLYIIAFLIRYSVVFLFLLPRMNGFFLFVSLSLFISSGISFIIASYKNPGYVELTNNMLEMYEKYKPDYICPYCKCKKIKTTRHCQHCKRCVKVINIQKFDHHCPWIHNCIGENNKKIFITFLLLFTIDLVFHTALGVLDYFDTYKQPHVLLPDIPTNHDEAALLVSCLCGLNLLIVLPVVYVQLGNLLKGQTTYERFGFGLTSKDSKISDTQSMLLGNENDWESYKTQNYSDLDTSNCCKKKSKIHAKRIKLSSQQTI